MRQIRAKRSTTRGFVPWLNEPIPVVRISGERRKMKSLRSVLAGLLAIVLPMCSADSVFADGKFFRTLKVADEPGIRAQRAVIAFKDGIETLIVQSDVEGQDASYGWLLPLPAEPTSIEHCQANTLNALADVVHPEVAAYPSTFPIFSFVLMFIVIAVCLDHLRLKRLGVVRSSLARILLGVVVVVLLAAVLLPSLGRSRGLSSNVHVLQTVKAGVYDVAIIKGETGDDVESWLTSNGFASPSSATAIIRDYVSRGWCFLAAKVSPQVSGTVTHHPLKVTFPTPQAIYPLRLTGSDGNPVQLDLFVIADRRASAPAMRVWVCDSYDRDADYHHQFDHYVCEVPPVYRSQAMSLVRIGIPAVSGLMWQDCVLTRLHARLDPSDMREDLRLTWLPLKPERVTLYGRKSAVGWSAAVAAIIVGLSFAWSTRTAARKGWSWQMMLRRRFPAAVLLGLLAGGARYATVEIVPVESGDRQTLRSMIAVSAHGYALWQLTENPPKSRFPDAYRDLLLKYKPDETLQEATDLDKPGDFKIEATDSGWRLTIINWPYIPVTIPISSQGAPQPAGD